MKLKFKDGFKRHISIKKSFEISDFKDFNVITGINGSGKTHFLRAIELGHIKINSHDNEISVENINFFDYESFKLKNAQNVSSQFVEQERIKIFNEFYKIGIFANQQHVQIWNNLNNHFNVTNKFFSLQKLLELNSSNELSQFSLDNLDQNQLNYFNSIKQQIIQPNFKTSMNHSIINNSILKEYLLNTKKDILNFDDNDIDKIILSYQPKNFLEKGFGEIFKKYNDLLALENNKTINRNKTIKQIEEKFEQANNELPWKFMNNIFETYSEKSFEFNYEFERPKEIANQNLKPKIKNKDGQYIEFEHLSSGEKVLLTLTLFLYQSEGSINFPKILLLDEIDATLHPSMCKKLIETLKENLVKNGTKIIFATHNPSTVASCDDLEDGIFVKTNEAIESKEKSGAVEILSDGIITLNKGMHFLDSLNKKELSIFTEGKNTKYIQKAIDLFLEQKDRKRISVIEGAEGKTGKYQLKTLFDFFCKIKHNKQVLFVWDCDCKKDNKINSLREDKNTIPFIFEQNSDNVRVMNGVENLFSKDLFEENFFSKKKTTQDEKIISQSEELKKQLFYDYICDTDKNNFKNFQPLIEEIKELLSKIN